jgi:hypothetical protein
MAKNDNLKDFLTDIADTIRAKKGTSEPINPQDFSAEIASIETGGGGGAETITYWDITDHLETLAELVLYAYLVKAESTSRGIFIVPIGIYYVEVGDTDQVSPKAIALDINRVVVVENNTPQSVYDILGTDDLTQFGARRLSKEDFYNTNI